jgi:hypothetical protein
MELMACIVLVLERPEILSSMDFAETDLFQMKSINIDAVLQDIIAQSETLAQQLIKDFSKQGVAAVRQFLTDSKGDLARWTGELAEKQITKDDFDDLVRGQVSAAVLVGLAETGLAQVEIDKFTNGVTNIIVSVAFNAAKSIV